MNNNAVIGAFVSFENHALFLAAIDEALQFGFESFFGDFFVIDPDAAGRAVGAAVHTIIG